MLHGLTCYRQPLQHSRAVSLSRRSAPLHSGAARLSSSRPAVSPAHRLFASTFSLQARFRPWPTPAGMSWSNVLQDYARLSDPSTLPKDVLLRSNDRTLTIFDGYEKAKFHFLVMPRDPFKLANGKTVPCHLLESLSNLLKSSDALEVLEALKEEAEAVKSLIRDEMLEKYGWTWPVSAGFHAVESMKHVHLHVISQDFISPKLKNKKHFNSFHPDLGFFLHLDDVIDDKRNKLHTLGPRAGYEQLLKQPMESHYTKQEFKTMPKLKEHLEQEWERRGKREKAASSSNTAQKRKASPDVSSSATGEQGSGASKKSKQGDA